MAKSESTEKKIEGPTMRVWVKRDTVIAGSFGTRTVPDGGGWIDVPKKIGEGLIEAGLATKDAPKNPARDN